MKNLPTPIYTFNKGITDLKNKCISKVLLKKFWENKEELLLILIKFPKLSLILINNLDIITIKILNPTSKPFSCISLKFL